MYVDQRTTRRSLTVLTALTLAFLTTATVRAEEKAPIPKKQVFNVYGGGCLRSWRLLGSYETAQAACDAAIKFRADNKCRAEVTTGKREDFIFENPTSITIYQRGARCGIWRIQTTVETRQKAEEVLKTMTSTLSPLELVLNYTPVN